MFVGREEQLLEESLLVWERKWIVVKRCLGLVRGYGWGGQYEEVFDGGEYFLIRLEVRKLVYTWKQIYLWVWQEKLGNLYDFSFFIC